jgi:hypothetical protein
MPVLENWRHELFARSIARGDSATQAYVGAGYSDKGASGNANKLLKVDAVAARIDELIRDGIDGQPGIGDIGLAQLLQQDSDVLAGLNFANVSSEWLQKELFRNLIQARAANNISAANKALELMDSIREKQGTVAPKKGRGRPRSEADPNKEKLGDAKSKPEISLSIINKVLGGLGDVPRNVPDPKDQTVTVTATGGDVVATLRDERPGSAVFSVDGDQGATGSGVPVTPGSRSTG